MLSITLPPMRSRIPRDAASVLLSAALLLGPLTSEAQEGASMGRRIAERTLRPVSNNVPERPAAQPKATAPAPALQGSPAQAPASNPPAPAVSPPPAPAALKTPPVAQAARRKAGGASGAKRYELGPGDVLTLGIQGHPELTRANVVVPPDGRISFLHAKQIPVVGKTVDELREAMAQAMMPFYRDPKIRITPVDSGSKCYTVLGEVRNNGLFPLTRPTTLLEALAQAGGPLVGDLDGYATELADLDRSFVMRGGRKLDLDLAALYRRGDQRHNILLEPDDYIYIASLVRNEIFVLGRVTRPGVYPIRPGMTASGAIAAAGGFAEMAWRNRVLVVRGRLNAPETVVVEMNRVLHGRCDAGEVVIQPGDIIYVSTRPWAYAAQIIDAALLAYIDGSVAGLLAEDDVGISVGPGL